MLPGTGASFARLADFTLASPRRGIPPRPRGPRWSLKGTPRRSGAQREGTVATVARDVTIRGEAIRLGQLLKLAGVVGAGGEVKGLLAGGAVRVNGQAEERRGRRLHPGDVVLADGEELRVVAG
jgi:ribosome-associated protein